MIVLQSLQPGSPIRTTNPIKLIAFIETIRRHVREGKRLKSGYHSMTDRHVTALAKLRAAVLQMRDVPRAVHLVWDAAPGWTLTWAGVLLLESVLPVSLVFLTRLLVNRLAGLGPAGPRNLGFILAPALAIAGVMLLSELFRSLASYASTVQAILLRDHIHRLVHGQAVRVDLAFYEQPKYFDHLYRARAEAGYRPAMLLQSVGALGQHGLTLIAMGLVLIPYGWPIPLLLLASTLPAFLVLFRYSYRRHQWRLISTTKERRAQYFSGLMTGRDSAAELRLFGLGELFQATFDSIHAWLRAGERRLAAKHLAAEILVALVSLSLTGLVMAWMVWRTWRQELTLGDLALFYQAFHQGQKGMHAMLQQVGQLYYNSLFLGNLFEYLELEAQVVSPDRPSPIPTTIRHGLRFHNVSFAYPGSDRPVLRNFNLTIPAGQTVALVGPNGAGKSTLTRLIMRFYDVSSGRITIDGIDLRELDLVQLRRAITVLFQTPVQYHASVTENIAWGDPERSLSQAAIRQAADAAGIDDVIQRFPDHYDQLLGNWFAGGTELSAGQWQRVALARAFVRRTPFIILDEPTSAMDPWAEADWLRRFRQLTTGRTTLLITHRFTTAMAADVIHVVEDGQIIESGSHDELLEENGQYAGGWKSQIPVHEALSEFSEAGRTRARRR